MDPNSGMTRLMSIIMICASFLDAEKLPHGICMIARAQFWTPYDVSRSRRPQQLRWTAGVRLCIQRNGQDKIQVSFLRH